MNRLRANRLQVCLLAAALWLLPRVASAQVNSYLVSRFLSETSCLWSGAGCTSGTCTVGHSPDYILRTTQKHDIWPRASGSVSGSVLPRSMAMVVVVASVTAVTPMYTTIAVLGNFGIRS
jgi:hypothetical protein